MDCASAAAGKAPLTLRRIETSRRQQELVQRLYYPSYRPAGSRCILSCSMKLPNPGHFGLPLGTSDYLNKVSEGIRRYVSQSDHLNKVSEGIRRYVPQSVKEFPWKKAEDLVLQRLGTFLRWSLVTFLVFSFVSDVFLSISLNKEFMMPAGLFTGVMVAQFLKKESKELNGQNGKDIKSLYNIGSIFVVVKLVLLYATSPGSNFIHHVCNGGLLQVLQMVNENQEMGNMEAESSTNINV